MKNFILKAVLRHLLATLTCVNPWLRCLIRHSEDSLTFLIASHPRTFLIAITLVSISLNPVFAEKELISITPLKKITTAKDKITEGDYVDFKVINSDKIIRGLVVKYEPNSWLGKEAILVIDQFRALNSEDKISGTLSLSGNQHNQAGEFLTWFDLWIRGGEVTILPEKDTFSLWREE